MIRVLDSTAAGRRWPWSGRLVRLTDRGRYTAALFFLAALLAYAPLVLGLARKLANEPWYGHVWIVPVVGLYLTRRRLNGPGPSSGGEWLAVSAVGAAAWLSLAAAVVLWSSWVSGVSLLLWAVMVAGCWCGLRGIRQVGALCLVLALALPLPLHSDRALIDVLRVIVSRWAGALLDMAGVVYFCVGGVFQVAGRELFTAQSCSGMHSLQALFVCAAVYALWKRRGLLHSLVFLLGAVSLALLVNCTRVAVMVWLVDSGWEWAGSRTGVVVSGISFFGLAVGLAWSWDQCLLHLRAWCFLLLPAGLGGPEWNEDERLGKRPAAVAAGLRAGGDNVLLDRAGPQGSEECGSGRSAGGGVANRPGVGATTRARLLAAASVGYAVLAVLQFCWLWSGSSVAGDVAVPLPVQRTLAGPLGAEVLDGLCRGWQRVEFERSGRDQAGGRVNYYKWCYERPGQTLLVTVSFPYPEVCDLRKRYTSGRWRNIRSRVGALADGGPAGDKALMAAELYREPGRRGWLLFTFLHPDGAAAYLGELEPGIWQRFKNRLSEPAAWIRSRPRVKGSSRLAGIELLVESGRPLSAAERREAQRLLVGVLDQLRGRLNGPRRSAGGQ